MRLKTAKCHRGTRGCVAYHSGSQDSVACTREVLDSVVCFGEAGCSVVLQYSLGDDGAVVSLVASFGLLHGLHHHRGRLLDGALLRVSLTCALHLSGE